MILSNLLIVAIAWIAFGATHSGLATARAKAHARRLLGPTLVDHLYRIVYCTIAYFQLAFLVSGLPVLLAPERAILAWPETLKVALLGVKLAGYGLIVVSLLEVDALEFFGVRQVASFFMRRPVPPGDDTLVVTGLFRFVRHPMMLGLVIVALCRSSYTPSAVASIVFTVAYVCIGCSIEEVRLRERLGVRYAVYARHVPMLVPYRLNADLSSRIERDLAAV